MEPHRNFDYPDPQEARDIDFLHLQRWESDKYRHFLERHWDLAVLKCQSRAIGSVNYVRY